MSKITEQGNTIKGKTMNSHRLAPTPRSACFDFVEHKDWRRKHPTGPVTWDAWCSRCGFRLEDKQWASGLAIEGDGRRLAHIVNVVRLTGETFVSRQCKIVCSKCCLVIL